MRITLTDGRNIEIDFKHECMRPTTVNMSKYRVSDLRLRELLNIISVIKPQTNEYEIEYVTTAIIREINPEDDGCMDLVRGYAFCSYADNFNKAVGSKIALKRALETANIEREDRRIIWEIYNSKISKGKIIFKNAAHLERYVRQAINEYRNSTAKSISDNYISDSTAGFAAGTQVI